MVPPFPHYNPLEIWLEKASPRESIRKMGILYIIAAACQSSWLVYIFINWDTAQKMMNITVFGWFVIIIWYAMLVLTYQLGHIGFRLKKISNDKNATFSQAEEEIERMRTAALFLLLGILVDITSIMFMIGSTNTEGVMFVSLIMFTRVALTNIMAVLLFLRL